MVINMVCMYFMFIKYMYCTFSHRIIELINSKWKLFSN